jgi:hypothetical protein
MAETPNDDDLEDPRWEAAGRVHDWRNHVPEEVRAMWPTLGREGRLGVYYMAQAAASAEEWD